MRGSPGTVRAVGRVLLAASFAAVAVVATAGTASAGGGCHGEYSEERTTVVTAAQNCMIPAVVRVDEGATVRFLNKDSIGHMFDGVAGTFGNHMEFGSGEWVEYRFDSNGIYPFFCVIHPGMVGAVVVGDGTGPGPAASGIPVSYEGTGGGDLEGSTGAAGEAGSDGSAAEASSSTSDPGTRGWWTGLWLGAVAAAGIALLIGIRRRRAAGLTTGTDQPA